MDLKLVSTFVTEIWNLDIRGIETIDATIKIVIDQKLDGMDDFQDVEIGYIEAYRFDLALSEYALYRGADSINGELAGIIEWFFSNATEDGLPDELLCADYFFYIQSVYIKPEYRRKDIGLLATSLFLNTFARHQVVACYPSPIRDLEERYSEQQGQTVLRRYWSRLGLTNYNADHNVLWQGLWEAPKALMAKLQ